MDSVLKYSTEISNKVKNVIMSNPQTFLFMLAMIIIIIITILVLVFVVFKPCGCEQRQGITTEKPIDTQIFVSPLIKEIILIKHQSDLMTIIGPKTPSLTEKTIKINDNNYTLITKEIGDNYEYKSANNVIDHLSMYALGLEKSIKFIYKDSSNFIGFDKIEINNNTKSFQMTLELFQNSRKLNIDMNFGNIFNEFTFQDKDLINYYMGIIINRFLRLMLPQTDIHVYDNDKTRIISNICEYVTLISGFALSSWKPVNKNRELPSRFDGAEAAYYIYYLNKIYPGIIDKLIEWIKTDKKLDDILIEHTTKNERQLWKDFVKTI